LLSTAWISSLSESFQDTKVVEPEATRAAIINVPSTFFFIVRKL
jgi:hypothetical protein